MRSKYPALSDSDSIYRLRPYILFESLRRIIFKCSITSGENEIYEISLPFHIPIKGLETVEEHNIPLQKMSLKEQLNQLEKFIDYSDSYPVQYEAWLSFYTSQNINAIAMEPTTKLAKIFIKDRNALWFSRIETALKENVIIAVGAGHLGGQDGLVNLLHRKGYVLTPIF